MPSSSTKHSDYCEAVQLTKRYEHIFDKHTFAKFKTGELFERPLQLFNQSPACISVHEPLSRPTVFSVIAQDSVDPQTSVVACKVTQTASSYIIAPKRESMARIYVCNLYCSHNCETMCQLTFMNLNIRVESKKHSIRLTLKNSTCIDLKLSGYVSSAPSLSQLLDMLSRSNGDASGSLNFESLHDSIHGMWIRCRYESSEARGFDIRICTSSSRPQDIVMKTDAYYIDCQYEENILSCEVTYTRHNTEEDALY
jgi:hypothetical protein